jgi:hypothetical protein
MFLILLDIPAIVRPREAPNVTNDNINPTATNMLPPMAPVAPPTLAYALRLFHFIFETGNIFC